MFKSVDHLERLITQNFFSIDGNAIDFPIHQGDDDNIMIGDHEFLAEDIIRAKPHKEVGFIIRGSDREDYHFLILVPMDNDELSFEVDEMSEEPE